jgi:hypothetical protein
MLDAQPTLERKIRARGTEARLAKAQKLRGQLRS